MRQASVETGRQVPGKRELQSQLADRKLNLKDKDLPLHLYQIHASPRGNGNPSGIQGRCGLPLVAGDEP